MNLALLLCSIALATEGFDPAVPAETFDGDVTWNQEHTVNLWSEILRFEDDESALFPDADWLPMLEWKDASFSPYIATMFEGATPNPGHFLLHVGPTEPLAHGTPILFVPGAGDNGSRGFITMATHQDRLYRPVYALTFAHPHGDAYQQAEVVADAIAAIKARTGAAQVDVVAHSKGGIAAVIYASNTDATDWGDSDLADAYEAHGTPYGDDIRRLVLIATPLGGIDAAYRWPANNFASLDPETGDFDPALTMAPTSWSTYYPYTTFNLLVSTDLAEVDFFEAGGDPFPGQRQLLARQPYDLPYELTWLQGYSYSQIDNLTTYEGGFGSMSYSEGIDEAVAAGGDLIATLEDKGVDPAVEVYLLAGQNPLMPNGDANFAATFEEMGVTEDQWADLIADIADHDIPAHADEDELDGLERGWLILGECTGPSDGLVFTTSALHDAAVTNRGAVVVEEKTADLSHLDLLYASPITGDLLIQAANDGEAADAWMRGVGKRYAAEDTIGWVEDVLADPDTDVDTDTDTDADTDTDVDTDTDTDADTDTDVDTDVVPEDPPRPCGGCDNSNSAAWWGLAGFAAFFARRRRN